MKRLLRVGLIVLAAAVCWAGAGAGAGEEPDEESKPQAPETTEAAPDEKLPALDDLKTPTVEQLLSEKPLDWILLNTDEVLIVESLVPRPGTLEAVQKKIDAKMEERRRAASPEDRERIQKELEEVSYLYVILPGGEGDASPEFKVPIRRVRGIIHHEDLMLRRANELLDERDIPQALELLTRLQRDRGEWEGIREAHERVLFVDGRKRIEEDKPESALMVLDELYQRNKEYPALSRQVGRAVRMLVEQALSEDDYLRAQFYLNFLQKRFARHEVFEDFDKRLSQRTREMLKEAAVAADDEDYRTAAVKAELAARIWPRTADLRGPHRTHAERYQRLHVGVVDLPGENRAYPLPSNADLRKQRLTELPLFEIDRIRDGTAYYRTRFFDEWEPFDLGREMRFTLKQFRQPYEMQAVVSTPDVVTPILNRLNPAHPRYDERLSAFIDSVIVRSPTEFRLTFRRVPPRLEPLLSRITVGTFDEDDGDSLAPLDDPGGFALIEQDDRQAVYRRTLEEPDGLPKYRVAEVVEHKYETPEKSVQGLYRGEVSMLLELPDWIVRRMQQDEEFLRRFFIQQMTLPQTHLLQFNPASEPLRIRELRTALAYAVDRERLLKETVLRDPDASHGRIVTTPFLSTNPGRNVLVEPRRFDLSSALAMSLAAGHQIKDKKIPKLTMVVAPGPVAEQAARAIARVWRLIGLEIDVVLAHEPQPEKWDILYRTIQMTEPIAEMWPFLTFRDRARLNDLDQYPDWLKQELVELDRTSDQTRAVTALQTLHRHLANDTAVVPLYEIDQFLIVRKNVTGFRQRPVHCYDLLDRWSVDAWYQTELP